MASNRKSKARRLAHVLHAVYCEPWLITPAMHATIRGILAAHIDGSAHQAGGIADQIFGGEDPVEFGPYQNRDGVAVIPVDGVIGKRVSQLEKVSGVVDVDDVTEAIDAANADPSVLGIVLDINSPGGTVTGTPELGAAVKASGKRVVAYTDTMAASAAYWIGSQASAFIAAPSASVGSIGVYLALLDSSRQAEAMGLQVEVIKGGKYKGMGIPGTSLTDEQRALLQSQVDALHADFKAAVRSMRGPVSDEVMQGQDFYGTAAREAGLIDDCGDLAAAIAAARL